MTTTRILITGLSGVGKSTVLGALRERGWRTVDTDEDGLVDARLLSRAGNPFGKDPAELERIRADLEEYEPALRRGADVVLDTSRVALADVVDRLDRLDDVTASSAAGAGR